ncbi:MAG: RagB/SusD family nutrient uptake outer membrane protein, partial [Bacteroidales bacterium]
DPNMYTARMMYLIRSRNYSHGAAYNQGGWNGASATLDAYNTFTVSALSGDTRKDETYFYGKVKGPNGDFIMNGDAELEYKPEAVDVDVSGSIYEKTAGARMFKYEVDITAQADGQLQNNDYVIFRYADILLIKAEAKVRKANGAATAGQAEFDAVRGRSMGTFKTATLDNILTERMLEFAWEGVRRQDLIRFGKFTKAISGRPASDTYRNVFPIPAEVDLLNENITQNTGY